MIGPTDCPSVDLVHPVDAAMDDLDRVVLGDRHRARFYEALHRLADLYGVELKQTPAQQRATAWDESRRPSQLVFTAIRFEHRDYPELRRLHRERRKRQRGTTR